MICVSWQKTLGTHTTMIYSGKERLRPPYNLSRLSHDFFKPKKKLFELNTYFEMHEWKVEKKSSLMSAVFIMGESLHVFLTKSSIIWKYRVSIGGSSF